MRTLDLSDNVSVVFKNNNNESIQLTITVKDLLDKTREDLHEMIEPDCTSSSCNNESQNFCDCGPVFEDYEIAEVKVL